MILENTYLQQLKQADPELADLFWDFWIFQKSTVNKMVHFISLQYATYGHIYYIRP